MLRRAANPIWLPVGCASPGRRAPWPQPWCGGGDRKGCCDEGDVAAAQQVPGSLLHAASQHSPLPSGTAASGAKWPTAPGGSVTSHHFHCLPLAAVPPSIIFGCPRSVRPGLAAPPVPTEQQGLITQCCGGCCPPLSPAGPAAPSPKSWKLLGVTQCRCCSPPQPLPALP